MSYLTARKRRSLELTLHSAWLKEHQSDQRPQLRVSVAASLQLCWEPPVQEFPKHLSGQAAGLQVGQVGGMITLPRAFLSQSPSSGSPRSSSTFISCLLSHRSPGRSIRGVRCCLPPSPIFQAGIRGAHSPDLWFGEASARPVSHTHSSQGQGV